MKRRKILVVIPALGLLLTGCSFQEGFTTAKHWVGQNIYHPVKDWIDGLMGKKEEPTPEPTPEPGPVDPDVAKPVEITEVRAPESIEQDATLDPARVPLSVKYSDGTTKTHAATDVKLDTSTVAKGVQGTAYYNDLSKAFTIDVVAKSETNYGTEDSPLSVSNALSVIQNECTTDGSLTKQRIYCVGLISVVDKTFNYESGPCFELHIADKEDSAKVVHVYRIHCTEEQKANVVVGAEIKFSGFAKNYKDELEFVDNGQEACSILTVTAPSGEDAVTGVAFNATSYEVAVGATAKVAATVQPLTAGNKNVTYSLKEVSPAGCVTISGDTLTGVAVGSAKVVVTTEEGGFTAEVPVSVVAATNYGTLDNPISVTAAKAIIDKECGTDKKSNTNEIIYCEAEIKTLGSYNDKGYFNAVTVKDEANEIYIHTLNVSSELKDSVVEGATIKFHGYGKYYNNAPQFGTANNVYVTIDSVITETPTVSAVTLDQSALALKVGAADVQLHATVEGEHKPSQAVTWHSSNEEAATVDENGFVHAVAEGEAEITATSVLDTKVVSEPCVVTVTEPETQIVLESISVTGPTKTSYTAGDKLDLTGLEVTAHYEGGASEVVEKWTSDPADGATLTTENEKVIITYEGKTAEVLITVEGVDPFVAAYEAGEALAHNKTTTENYTFSGVVVAKRATDYYVQNGSYGIDLYNPGSVEGLAVGKEVTVTAKMKKYSGVIETAASPTVVVGDQVETLPASTTIDSAATLEAAKQNIRVNVSGEVTAKSTNSGGDVTLTLKVNGDSIPVFIKSGVKTIGTLPALVGAEEGQLVTLTDAVRGIYSNTTSTTHQIIACEDSVATVISKPIESIGEVTGPSEEVPLNGEVNIKDISVTVNYEGGSSGPAIITEIVDAPTNVSGPQTGHVHIEGWEEAIAFTYTVASAPAQDVVYNKVVAEQEDWSGSYLLVNETASVAFNGADTVGGNQSVTIANSSITNPDKEAVVLVVEKMTGGYSIKVTGGTNNPNKYIGQTSYANGLAFRDTPIVNTFAIDNEGNVSIVCSTSDGDVTLKYNDAANQTRFRYYKSGQKAVQLYKLAA